ncbi:rhomboid family intramembrane serine protease [Salibacterium qingdaonense]|uniref:Membrane associated serine protease, rhomboid family n=1 Tax=Salibacterium qingdaonense TaxID=266892 RepID=A0A1I4I7N6_9BACI|nr:rhomboid family intramembrane serine protease [Salibacterium qingdaonense]SFL50389.1 Membrane associated serine protease, rhomboid family [Salibacterium qingdaonense]
MFIRNETFYSFRKNYPVITCLTAIHLILFLWINLSIITGGLIPFGGWILQNGAGSTGAIRFNGEYWRLFTPIFLHRGIEHVLFNSISLILFGPALERMLGKVKFISVYLSTGIIANIATTLLTGFSYSHIGASGAIFGLFGIYLYMVLYRKDLIDAMNARIIMVITVLGVVMTFLSPNINVLGHLFGLIAGAALAPPFLIKARPFNVMQVRRRVPGDNEVGFNPDRWKKRRILNGRKASRILGWIFAALVIIGILSTLF